MKKTIIVLTIAIIFAGLIFSIHPAEAQLQYTPEVGIPGEFEETMDVPGDTSAIGNYIKAIYSYSIGIVGILAAVVLMIGGVTWLTAGGNANKVESAKQWIGGALTGLVLALSSYMILLQINPELVNFHVREITDTEEQPSNEPGCCQYWDPNVGTTDQLCSQVDEQEQCKTNAPMGGYELRFFMEDATCIRGSGGGVCRLIEGEEDGSAECKGEPNTVNCVQCDAPNCHCWMGDCRACNLEGESCTGNQATLNCCGDLMCMQGTCVQP